MATGKPESSTAAVSSATIAGTRRLATRALRSTEMYEDAWLAVRPPTAPHSRLASPVSESSWLTSTTSPERDSMSRFLSIANTLQTSDAAA